jgi:hypothetical protein
LASERKRRKKLNDGLYSLRGLVPKISKVKWSQVIYHFHFLESNHMVLDHIVIL